MRNGFSDYSYAGLQPPPTAVSAPVPHNATHRLGRPRHGGRAPATRGTRLAHIADRQTGDSQMKTSTPKSRSQGDGEYAPARKYSEQARAFVEAGKLRQAASDEDKKAPGKPPQRRNPVPQKVRGRWIASSSPTCRRVPGLQPRRSARLKVATWVPHGVAIDCCEGLDGPSPYPDDPSLEPEKDML